MDERCADGAAFYRIRAYEISVAHSSHSSRNLNYGLHPDKELDDEGIGQVDEES